VHGQGEGSDVGPARCDLLEEIDAVRAAERNVDDRKVGLEGPYRVQGLPHTPGLATDLEIRLLVHEQRQTAAHEWMIVHDQYSRVALPVGTRITSRH